MIHIFLIILKILALILLNLNLSGCTKYNYTENIKENRIIIEKINLDAQYEIKSLNDKITEIVMFEECGRPDKNGSNTVIGSHSGSSKYAYFNDIEYLRKKDKIIIVYNNNEYTYLVESIDEVSDTDISVLNNNGTSMLTLLTCNKKDNSKRIVIKCNLVI